MTYEELEALVANGDPMAVAEALSPLDERARKKLSVQMGKLYQEIDRGAWQYESYPSDTVPGAVTSKRITSPLKRLANAVVKKSITIDHQLAAAKIAVVAVCPFTQTKKIDARMRFDQTGSDALAKAMIDRKPDWADAWVASHLSGEWFTLSWSLHRELITEGVCTKPDSEDYVRFFASHPGMDHRHRVQKDYRPPSAIIRDEPDLLDDVWRLFEVETAAFVDCWYQYTPEQIKRMQRPTNYEQWRDTILNLMRSGHLDRDRLLDASLRSLTTGFKQNVLSGFAKMHALLEPTDDEVAARQEAYLDLLAVPTGQVVSFAVKMLKRLAKAKTLDAGAFLAEGARVFALSTKSQPKAVLSMAKPLMKKHAEHRRAGLSLALEGLTHADGDVQSAALGLLALYPDDAPRDAGTRLGELIEDLPATLRGEAGAVLAALGGEAKDVETAEIQGESEVSEEDPDVSLVELRERAAALDAGLRATLGVDDALSAIAQGPAAPPLSFSVMEAPVLASCAPITPIETVDELLDAAAHAVEKVDSADEIERLIDGISRLCDQRTEDFEARAAPIINRLTGDSVLDSRNIGWPGLILAWLHPKSPKVFASRSSDLSGFQDRRIAEAGDWVCHSTPRLLLSMPTHRGGWIDPRVFADRLITLAENRESIPHYDLIVALLRLAPDHRDTAREAVADVPGNVGRIVRWALGGEDGPTDGDRPDRSLWLAAGRTRSPFDSMEALATPQLHIDGPYGTQPAVYSYALSIRDQYDSYAKKTYHFPELDLKISPPYSSKGAVQDRWTVLLSAREHYWHPFSFQAPWAIAWTQSYWPINPDPLFAAGIEGMLSRLDENASTFDPNHALLQGLFLPDRPWTEVARLAVWLALAGKDADVRGVAMDALIEAVDDGRAHPEQMADTLLILAPREAPGWLKLNRLAANLGEVARVSELHAWFVACCVERLVGAWDKPPRDAHHALSLLLEVKTQLGLVVDNAARAVLAAVKGSSKTAKLAKALLALEADGENAALRVARLRMAETRVERSERWAQARG